MKIRLFSPSLRAEVKKELRSYDGKEGAMYRGGNRAERRAMERAFSSKISAKQRIALAIEAANYQLGVKS